MLASSVLFQRYLKRLHAILGRVTGSRVRRRRTTTSMGHWGPALESLEERLCLNGTASLTAAIPTTSTQIGADGSMYIRLGNQQNAGPMHGQGGAALEGGGTDVDQAFQWMIGRMGGKGDFLVLRSTDDPGYNPYIYDFGGTNSVSTLVIPNQGAALDPAVKQIIQNADAVFIGGGAQNEYVDWWQGTPVQQAIAADIARGVPVGGTSAGTAILGQYIYSAEFNSIRSPQALTDPFDPNLTLDQNFVPPNRLPFLNNTLVDTHFENRDRTGRMLAFLAAVDTNGWSSNQKPMGIGINQETALLITPNGQAQVIGNADAGVTPAVDFFETPGLPQVDQPGQPLTYLSILEDQMTIGGTFNLNHWNTSFAVNNEFTTHFTDSVVKGVFTQTLVAAASAASGPSVSSLAASSTPIPVGTGSSGTAVVTHAVTTSVAPHFGGGANFTPTSFTDSYNSAPGTVVSLRDAVVAANNSGAGGTVTINLKAGTYSLSLPQGGQEDGTNGDLIVSNTQHTLVINGNGTSGSGATMIDASLLGDRIFQLLPGNTVILQNLILTGGVAMDDGVFGVGPALGGAILDNGQSLTLNNVWVVGNQAQGGSGEDAEGGGIFSGGGTLALYRSLIATNEAIGGSSSSSSGIGGNGGNGQGGGIYAAGGAIILGTTANPDKIESNYAIGGTGGTGTFAGGNGGNAQGGGLFVGAGVVSLKMSHGLFSSNFAQAGTGGSGSSGVGGNGGSAQGAGLFISAGSVTVNSNTDVFAFNRATAGAGSSGSTASGAGGAAQGAGLYFSGGSLNLTNDTFANNVALGGTGAIGGTAQGAGLFAGNGQVGSTGGVFASNVALGGACTIGAGPGGAGQGGGIFVSGGALTLSGNAFQSNAAVGGMGGDVDDSSTAGDGGAGAGGGLYANSDSLTVKMTGDALVGNLAAGGRGGSGGTGGAGGAGQGGGALMNAGTLSVNSAVVKFNTAFGGTGGQAAADGQGGNAGAGEGGGLFVNRDSSLFPVTIHFTKIQANTAEGGVGGGVFSGGTGGAGGDGQGGGLFLVNVQPPLGTDTIHGNAVTGGAGGLAGSNGSSGVAQGPQVYFTAGPVPFTLRKLKSRSNARPGD